VYSGKRAEQELIMRFRPASESFRDYSEK